MKRIGTALTIVFIIAGFAISFFIGHYVSDKSHTESRAAQFDKYISRAIDTIKDKGLSIDGAPEAIASNIWVAHEFCDSPEISAELSNLWNTIVYEKDVLMQAGAARLIYVVFSNLIQIPLLILVSHFFSRKENVLRVLWLLPIIAIQIASIAVCYVVQYHAADENFPDYLIGFMAVLLLINILIVFYVEALRKNEQEKFRAEFNEQQYRLQMEYYQQLKERQEETRALWHDIKKYILAMQAVAGRGNSEELHKIVRDATDAFERSKNISTIGNPVVDALLNQYLHTAEENGIKVTLDVTIPEVLSISPLSLSILIGNTFDNAIEACCGLPSEQRKIHLQLRKQYRSLFYRLDNPYSDISRSLRVGSHHGYGLKNVKRVVKESDGDFYAEKKNGTFTVKVRLNCEN